MNIVSFPKFTSTILKKFTIRVIIIPSLATLFALSCKKESTFKNSTRGKQPPIAQAQSNQMTVLAKDTLLLDGSGSSDLDGNITSYRWAKIAGPDSLNILNANAVKSPVTGLRQGMYKFELKVTDATGLFSTDTIQITAIVPVVNTCGDTNRLNINAQLIPVGTLSQARGGMAVASAENKILFAGGFIPPGGHSSKVDIYDLANQTWSTAELSEARSTIAAIGAGGKIFFAGGEISDGTCATKTVDIYDVSNNKWSTSALSIPGSQVTPAAVGDKVLFSGGDPGFCGAWARTTTVDIYNHTTNTWSTAPLSDVKRGGHAAVTINNKVYFSGGESWTANPVSGSWYASSTIDIYDDATASWSTSYLTEGKLGHTGVVVKDNIFWAGGTTGASPSITGSCNVEIKNVNTGAVSIQKLFQPGYRTGVVKNNQIIFYGGDYKFDVYDVTTDRWSIAVLPIKLLAASIISVNNTIYLAGGSVNGVLSNKVWKLEL